MSDEPDKIVTPGISSDEYARQIEAMNKKNRELLDEKKKEQAAREALEARIAAIEAEKQKIAEENAAKDAKENGRWEEYAENRVKKVREEADSVIEQTRLERDRFKNRYIKDRKDNALSAALDEFSVPAYYKDAVKALIGPSLTVEEENDDIRVYFDVDGNRYTVKEYIKIWASSDAGKHFIVAPSNSGTNAPPGKVPNGSGGKNPFMKDPKQFNMTEQAMLKKNDPARARRLAQEAGLTVNW